MKQSRRKKGFIFAVLILALSFLISCGGGGGDGGAAPAPVKAPLSGIFKNSPVHGAFYETLTLTGQTSDAGAFSYGEGETVTFYVGKMGGLKLGSASGADVLTPVDLVPGAANVLSPRVTNISRLLQTLDEDGDLSNGIKINTACNTHIAAFIASNSIDLSDTVDFEAKMTGLLVTLNADPAVFTAATPRTLKTSAEARLQLETSMKGPVGEIQVTTGAESIVADGSNAVAVQAAVANVEGDALIGVPVTFSATYGALSSLTAYTNAYGVAEVMLTSGTTTGSAVVTASSGGFTDTVAVQFTSGAPAGVTVTATPSTVNPGGASSLTARVVDGNGNAVVGETVTVDITTNASGGSLSAISGTTNINGDVTVTYTAGSGTGNDVIRFRAASNNTAGTVTVTVDASAQVVGSLALTTGAASIIANGTSTVAVRALIADTSGSALSGVTVNFGTTLGTLSAASAATNALGVAEVTLTSGTAAGTASITASASGFTDTVTVQFTSGAPATVTVTATPATVNPGGASSLTARVIDGNGNAVVGETVTVDITTNASGGSLSAISGTTNVNGDVTVTYTAGSGTGNDIIRFRAASNNTAGTATVTVDASAQVVGSLALTTGAASIIANGTSTVAVRALIADTSGSALSGVTVNFGTTLGTLSAASAVTNASGIAEVTLTSGTAAGTAVITASASGFTDTITVQCTSGAPAGVTVTATPSTVNPGGASSLTARVVDGNGNAVVGETVTVDITMNASGGALSAISGTTNVNGDVTVTYTAGSGTGNDIIRFRAASNNTAGTATVTVDASAQVVGSLSLSTGAASIIANGTSTAAVRAEVRDSEGVALSGVTVNFGTTLGTLSAASAATNASGIAEVTLTSGAAAGTAVITASASGFTDTITVQFTSGVPAGVTVTATPSTVNPGGASSLTARVVDGNGNAVVGETVTVDITTNASGGALSAISGTTNVNGDVTVTYTAGSGTGNDVIRLRAASNNTAGTVTVTVDASAQVVGSLSLSTGAASIIANGTSTVAVRALIEDTSGSVLSGVTVNFGTTLGTLSAASAATTASGIAEVTLTSGTAAGTAVITASASGFTDTVDVQCTSGAPAGVTVTATPSTVNPGGASSLTARVVDGNGNAVVGESVTVDITTNASGGALSAISGTTNINGDVTVTYTAGSGTGNDVIRFRAVSNNTVGTVTVTVDAGAQAALIKLSALPLAVRSDNSNSATITATVLDSKNAVVEGLTVQFEATGGQISASSAVTDAQGEATVTFSAGTVDPSNQVATVTGRVSTLSSMVPVRIEGSTVEMEHTTLTIYDDGSTKDTLKVTARDAASNPVYGVSVTLTVMPGTGNATVTPASGTTDVYGEFTATVTGTLAGDVTVEATALGDTAEKTYDVIASGTPVFEITSPPPEDPDDPKPYAMKTSDPPLSVTAQAPGLATVRFATSLGILTNTALAAGNVVDEPVVGGIATVTFTPTEAGLALIQAFDPDDPDTRDTRRIAITAPVGAAAFINLQPSATVVARNLTEMTNTVTIKATVMTTEATGYQVVKDAPVFFSLENPAGGGEGVSPVVVYTDDKGEAKTTFTSGKLSSMTPVVVAARVLDEGSTGPLANVISFNDNNPAADTITRADGGSFVGDGFEAGEKIRVKGSQSNDGTYIIETVAVNTLTLKDGESLATEAAAAGVTVTILAVADSTEITIGGTAGAVVIGVGTVIEAPDPAYYKLPMAVQVADHNGQGIKDAVVTLNLWPAFYRTGGWYDEDPKGDISYASYVSGTFANEDVNENLIMEPGEDVNGDDFLTPPNSAGGSVPPTVTTDENGVVTFELVYLKTNGRWITDRITASTVVLGTQVSSQRYVPLQILESDVTSGDLPATSPNAPYPLQFKIPVGGTTVPHRFPVFRGTIDATHDDTYTASEGSTVGNVYTFTDPGGHASGDVIEDTVTISGWVLDDEGNLGKVYRFEPVFIVIE